MENETDGDGQSPRIDPDARVGRGTKVWGHAEIRENAVIGRDCVIGSGVYIDVAVKIGNRCKIQNGALVYAPAVIEDGVFIGPGAILTNDRVPRAVNPDGTLKGANDWTRDGSTLREGATIGAGAVVLPGIDIGRWSMIGAAAVVTDNVPAHALMVGAPASQRGWVGRSGHRLLERDGIWVDPDSEDRYVLTDQKLSRA